MRRASSGRHSPSPRPWARCQKERHRNEGRQVWRNIRTSSNRNLSRCENIAIVFLSSLATSTVATYESGCSGRDPNEVDMIHTSNEVYMIMIHTSKSVCTPSTRASGNTSLIISRLRCRTRHEREPPTPQAHNYTTNAERSPHIARGDGLYEATTGVPASFTIELVGDDGSPIIWKPSFFRFIYVWIASEDQVGEYKRNCQRLSELDYIQLMISHGFSE